MRDASLVSCYLCSCTLRRSNAELEAAREQSPRTCPCSRSYTPASHQLQIKRRSHRNNNTMLYNSATEWDEKTSNSSSSVANYYFNTFGFFKSVHHIWKRPVSDKLLDIPNLNAAYLEHRDRNKEIFLLVRRTSDHVRLTCPPILSLVQKSCIDQCRTTKKWTCPPDNHVPTFDLSRVVRLNFGMSRTSGLALFRTLQHVISLRYNVLLEAPRSAIGSMLRASEFKCISMSRVILHSSVMA